MVERYSLSSLDGVAATFGGVLGEDVTPRFNIAPLQRAPIRTAGGLMLARWGLLPPWRGHGGKRGPHVPHAPIDALDGTVLLRNAFKRQRCLVVADGFFVWRRAGKRPQPIWIHPAPAGSGRTRAVGLAGIAATNKDDRVLSFALLVGPAGPLVASALATGDATDDATGRAPGGAISGALGGAIGDAVGRAPGALAPFVVPAERFTAWLDGPREAALALLVPPEAGWRAEPVSTWVNSVEHDDARCVEPLGNPAQGELF